MDWTLIETDSDLLCGNRVKRHHIVKLIRLEIWAGWFRNNGCYWLTTPHPSPSPPLGWVEGWTPLQPLAPSGATALRARSQLMWSHGFLQAPALSRPLSGSNPRGARKCPRGQSTILFFGGLLLCIPLSLSVQSTVYFLVCDCDWWSESFAKGRSIWMIQNNCKNIVFLDRPLQAGWPIRIIRLVCKRVVLTSDPICKWSFILACLLCKERSNLDKIQKNSSFSS